MGIKSVPVNCCMEEIVSMISVKVIPNWFWQSPLPILLENIFIVEAQNVFILISLYLCNEKMCD